MAQSEAGRSVTTVPNDEEEEEFGPQLITKLEVGAPNKEMLRHVHCHIMQATHFALASFQVNGITSGDIKKLQAEGYHTIDSLMFVPKKALL